MPLWDSNINNPHMGYELEINYFNTIRSECNIIFDVGASYDSIFINEEDLEVHYFEPFEDSFNKLKELPKNKKCNINNMGLSDELHQLPYFAEGSLFDRNMSKNILQYCDTTTGKEYCTKHNISNIDFLKIDVEGMETKVLRGFGNILSNTKYIQFEYGVGLRDAGSNLKEIFDCLSPHGFKTFHLQTNNGLVKLTDSKDFWQWYNICTTNENLIC